MTKPKPKLTVESLHLAVQPPNNCRVKAFRDTLDDDSRAVLDEALGYRKDDLPASTLCDWLVSAGFDPESVPGADAVNDHRAGRRPCRCRG